MKRIGGLVIALILMAALLVGCGTKDNPSSNEADKTSKPKATVEKKADPTKAPEEEKKEPVTVTLSGWFEDRQMDTIVAAIQEQLPEHITVEYTFIAHAQYNTVMSTQLAAGEGPDVLMAGVDLPAKITAGYVKDITGAPYLDNFNPAGFTLCNRDGKTYGFPSYGFFTGVWFNPEMFDEYDIAVPTTFAGFVAACDTLAANGIQPLGYGLADGNGGIIHLLGYLEAAYFKTPEGKGFNEKFAKGETTMAEHLKPFIDEFAQLINKGYITKEMLGITVEQARAQFANGEVAIFCGGPWDINIFKGFNEDVKMDMMPYVGGDAKNIALAGGPSANYAINVNAKHPEEADILMEAIASVEVMQAVIDANPASATFHYDAVSTIPDEFNSIRGILESGDVASPWHRWTANLNANTMLSEFMKQFQMLVSGSVTSEEFLENLDTFAATIRFE